MRILILGGLLGTASAADMHVLDLRSDGGVLTAQVRSESQTVTTPMDGTPATTSSDSRKDGVISLREGIGGMRGRLGPHGGLLWGAGFAVSHYYFHGSHTRIVNPVLDAYIGYGYAPNSWLHFEAAPFIGGGFSLLTLEPSTGRVDNRSRYFEYGIRLGVYATLVDSWQAGFEIPTFIGHARPKYPANSDGPNPTVTTQTSIFRASGGMLTLGIHF